MRHAALFAAALALATTGACVQEQTTHPIKDALPTADQVQVKLPQATNAFALGQLADFYVLTRNVTRNLNGGTAWVLILVHTIVQFPATTVDGDTYTWGPFSNALDPADYRLVVVDNADGSYDWSLDGQSKTTPEDGFLTIISGNAVPSQPEGHGRGTFFIDFDAAERVNPVDNDARGTVEVSYDLENRDGTAATIAMHADSTDDAGQATSFDYQYNQNLDDSGDFQFALNADLDDDGALAENAIIRSRWLPDGQGRGDARVSGGDLADITVDASECWDSQFRRVYYADSADWQPSEGDASACAFADQDLPSM